MAVISLKKLNKINLEVAAKSIEKYSVENGLWLNQYDNFFNNIRLNTSYVQRMTKLLNIVRYNGWNMNRQGQCASILKALHTGKITDDQLGQFWGIVDKLPNISLCVLPNVDKSTIDLLRDSFAKIQKILSEWHSSAGTVCFLTKVILMFNWGHTPAYDTRIREKLGLNNSTTINELTESLVEIGRWLRDFENRFGINFDNFATDIMRTASRSDLHPLPSGRSFDMMLFSF